MHRFTDKFAEYCKQKYLNDLKTADNRSYCYKSLPLCIIDCVYSLRTKYDPTTLSIVKRYADKFLDGDKTSSDEQDNLLDFIEHLTTPSLQNFADNIVKNHQLIGGVPKEKVCFDIAKNLLELNIKTFKDFQKYPSREKLAEKIRDVKGIGDAGVNYLFMLTGDDDKSKPDVHIHNCIIEACGEGVSNQECQIIFEETVEELKNELPNLTVRQLDSVIWKDFSTRKKEGASMKNNKINYYNNMNNKKYLIEYKKLHKNPIDAWVWFAEMTDKRDFPAKDFDFGYEQDYYLACENLGIKPPVDLKEKALENPELCNGGEYLSVFLPDNISRAILDLYD